MEIIIGIVVVLIIGGTILAVFGTTLKFILIAAVVIAALFVIFRALRPRSSLRSRRRGGSGHSGFLDDVGDIFDGFGD